MSEILKENYIRELTAREIRAVSGGDNDDENLGNGDGGFDSSGHGGGGSTISDFPPPFSLAQWE